MYNKPFFFREDGLLKKINLDDIIYVEAAKNYTKLYTAKKAYIARIALDAAMNVFPENKFLRVHRSYAVAAEHIDAVGRDYVRLSTMRKEVPVSRKYYAAFTKQVVILDTATIIDSERKRTVRARK
jgi:two-component system LytT family response regulator